MLAWDSAWLRMGLLALLLLAVLTLLGLWAARRRNSSPAWLRLDWYLPVLRKARTDRPAAGSRFRAAAQRILPAAFFSNRQTKQRGWIRRALRWIGLSWQAAPLRRLSQAACLLTFLGLFLYVCWPYSARPAAPRQLADAMAFQSIDQATGQLRFVGSVGNNAVPGSQRSLYLIGPAGTVERADVVRQVTLVESAPNELHLLPSEGLDEALLDALLAPSPRQWKLLDRDPQAWPSHYADELSRKEWVPAELFLAIDPLVSLSTAVASRSWVWSLASAAVILAVCLLIPRGFCGYLCPLGTTIDLFDWAIGKRVTRFRLPADGWWVHIKYYLLAGTLVAAAAGILVSGFFSAIPVITRACLMLVDPLQNGTLRGWHLIPGMNLGHLFSIGLFFAVLGLGFFRPRFWCKYVCPSGAVFSLGNLLRLSERKVESSCIHCNKCVEICPFDAIKPDFTTRVSDCTLCQSCAGVCPTHAIKFVERGNRVELKVLNDPPTHETALGRRGFLSLAGGSAAAVVGGLGAAQLAKVWGADAAHLPVRPPGSVPEKQFLEMCIRCGECFKVCPNNVLQVQGFEQGLQGLWTPVVRADWAGCESSCNACGQVCPTGAIRALPLEEKRYARMGLAIVNPQTCLPLAGREECDLCVQECRAAGYHAIEYQQVGTQVDAEGQPIEGSGFLAPVVLDDRCVGCGLCQTRCHAINVKERHVLSESAIVVHTGEGREDRWMEGSYREANAPRGASNLPQSNEDTSARNTPAAPATNAQTPAPEPAAAPPAFGDNPFGL